MKTKIIYRNKELEKRINAKDIADAKAFRERKEREDPIAIAFKEANKSPQTMFKESMRQFNNLFNGE